MARRYDHRRVKIHHPYTIPEIVRLLGVSKLTVSRWIARGLPLVTPALLVEEFANMGAHFDALLDAASAPAALLAAAVLAHSSYAAGAYAHAGLWGALERASDAELRAASAAADASLLARHVHPLDSLAHVIADLYVSLYGAEWEAPSGLEFCRVEHEKGSAGSFGGLWASLAEHEKGSAGSAGSFTGWSRADGRWYSRMAYCQPRPGGPWGRDEPDGAVDGEHSARAAQCVRLARAESLAAALGADAGGTVLRWVDEAGFACASASTSSGDEPSGAVHAKMPSRVRVSPVRIACSASATRSFSTTDRSSPWLVMA